MSLTTYALLYRVFSKCFQENNNVITLWTNFSRHTSLTYLKVVHYTDLLPILLYAKNWVFDIYTFGDIMFPVTHTFWELRLGVVRIRGVAPLELSGWTEIFLEMNFSGTFVSIIKIYLLHSNYKRLKNNFFRVSSHLKVSVLFYPLSHKNYPHVDEAWPLKLVY